MKGIGNLLKQWQRAFFRILLNSKKNNDFVEIKKYFFLKFYSVFLLSYLLILIFSDFTWPLSVLLWFFPILYLLVLNFNFLRINKKKNTVIWTNLVIGFVFYFFLLSSESIYHDHHLYFFIFISFFFLVGGDSKGMLFSSLALACAFSFPYMEDNSVHFFITSVLIIVLGYFSEFILRVMTEKQDLKQEELEFTLAEVESQNNFIKHIGLYDGLTGLVNRGAFMGHILRFIKLAKRNEHTVALLFIDIDRFKYLNDSLGYEVGDKVLKMIADRLGSRLRRSDIISRLAGDEFVVLLPEVKVDALPKFVAQKILKMMEEPFQLNQEELRLSASIGIATYNENIKTASALLKHAEVSMFAAKEQGKNTFCFYSEQLNNKAMNWIFIERELHHAIKRNELVVFYQPFVDISTEKVVGAEALVRWNHPEKGIISPFHFISVAEESGHIHAIGNYVFEEALKQHVAWREMGLGEMIMGINVSARQFNQSTLTDRFSHIFSSLDVMSDCVELELTEGLLMESNDLVKSHLRKIKELNFKLSIDDFGTGYSALSYLKKLDVHTLKVDRSFVKEMFIDETYQAIVKAIISLGKSLNLKLVAEGIETREQLLLLKELGCDVVQGYLFSPPKPAWEITDYIRRQNNLPVEGTKDYKQKIE